MSSQTTEDVQHETANKANWVLPDICKVGNIANKGLHGEEQKKFSQKIAPIGDCTHDLFIITHMLLWLC